MTRTVTHVRTSSWSVNLLLPVNVLALVFGGRWVLALIGLHPTWTQYLLAGAVAWGTWCLAKLKYTITWTRTRWMTRR